MGVEYKDHHQLKTADGLMRLVGRLAVIWSIRPGCRLGMCMIGSICYITVIDCKRETTVAQSERGDESSYTPKLQDQVYHSVQ